MITGTVLIICGLLIAIYPPLLSLIVAVLLMAAGCIVFIISYRYKKRAKTLEDPFLDLFLRM